MRHTINTRRETTDNPGILMKNEVILMAHGGGGVLTGNLIREIILRELGNPILAKLDDGACIDVEECHLVMTTDSYVIDPIFFPGGDIGKLAVCGTVNDLVMQGAEPRYMSLALIIEEGLPLSDFEKIICSIGNTARETGVQIVTGDTKVIERRKKGGIFINTTGIGVRVPGSDVSVSNAKQGDVLIISGTIGDHGIAIMNVREGLNLQSDIVSDATPLWGMMKGVITSHVIHCLRDPTRGGVAAAVCDIADSSRCSILIEEASLPVRTDVTGACDLLGLEPVNVANEGKALIVCPADSCDGVLASLRAHESGRNAAVIGKVVEGRPGMVYMRTRSGGERIIDIPTGEDLPRIC